MGEENYNKLLNIALGAVVKDNKILLIKRSKKPYLGYWALPGGKIEYGEHPEEAALREIKEETGLDCESQGLKGIISELIYNNNNKKVAHFMLFIHKLKPLDTNIEGELECKWFDLKNLEESKIVVSDMSMIKEFILKENNIKIHKVKIIENNEEYILEEFK
jgi:8-oxo-dGTP diphosphatase